MFLRPGLPKSNDFVVQSAITLVFLFVWESIHYSLLFKQLSKLRANEKSQKTYEKCRLGIGKVQGHIVVLLGGKIVEVLVQKRHVLVGKGIYSGLIAITHIERRFDLLGG